MRPRQSSTTDTSATSESSTTAFPFFKLPRELRDEIYHFLYNNDSYTRVSGLRIERAGHRKTTITTRRPVLQAFLLNRQFKSEYEQSPAAGEHCTTFTLNKPLGAYPYLFCRPSAKDRITYLKLKFDLLQTCTFCDGGWDLNPSDVKKIAYLVEEMPALKELGIRFCFQAVAPNCNWEPFVDGLDLRCQLSAATFIQGFSYPISPCRWTRENIGIVWNSQKDGGAEVTLRFAKFMPRDGLQFDDELSKRR